MSKIHKVARVVPVEQDSSQPLDFRATHRAFGRRGGDLGLLNATQLDADDLETMGVVYAVASTGHTLLLNAELVEALRVAP